jgi:hypothetical protein
MMIPAAKEPVIRRKFAALMAKRTFTALLRRSILPLAGGVAFPSVRNLGSHKTVARVLEETDATLANPRCSF